MKIKMFMYKIYSDGQNILPTDVSKGYTPSY